MKTCFVLLACILFSSLAAQQLIIGTGARLQATGVTITANGVDIHAKGSLQNNNASIALTGTGTLSVQTSDTLNMGHLVVNKGSGVAKLTNKGIVKLSSLQLQSGYLDIGESVISIHGAIEGNGKLRANSKANLYLSQNASGALYFDETADSSSSLGGLYVEGGNIELRSKLNLYGKLQLESGKLDLGGKNLVLKATRDSSAYIAAIKGELLNSSNITTEKYIDSGRRAYRLFSHPFAGNVALSSLTDNLDITGAGGIINGFTPTQTNNPSAFWFNTVANKWESFANATDTIGNNSWKRYQGIRVLVRGAKGQGLNTNNYQPLATTIDVTGSINKGTVVVPLIKGTSTGWNLVGNPYPAPIQMQTVIDTLINEKINGLAYYIWNPFNQQQGSYEPILFSEDYVLPMLSAFFVEVSDNTSISFNEDNKCLPGDRTAAKDGGRNSYIMLKLLKDNNPWDKLYIVNDSLGADALDKRDTRKVQNPQADLFTLSADSVALGVDRRKIGFSTIIPLGIRTIVPGSYQLLFNSLPVPANLIVLLKDNFTNQLEPVTEGFSYSFVVTSQPASHGNRFALMFQPNATLSLTGVELEAFRKERQVNLQWSLEGLNDYSQFIVQRSSDAAAFNSIGVVGKQDRSLDYSFVDAKPFASLNFYRIKSMEPDGSFRYSKTVMVDMSSHTRISVYPNPVKQGVINVTLSEVPAGNYLLILNDNNGRQVAVKQVQHRATTTSLQLQIPAGLTSGVYNLIVKGKLTAHMKVMIDN